MKRYFRKEFRGSYQRSDDQDLKRSVNVDFVAKLVKDSLVVSPNNLKLVKESLKKNHFANCYKKL